MKKAVLCYYYFGSRHILRLFLWSLIWFLSKWRDFVTLGAHKRRSLPSGLWSGSSSVYGIRPADRSVGTFLEHGFWNTAAYGLTDSENKRGGISAHVDPPPPVLPPAPHFGNNGGPICIEGQKFKQSKPKKLVFEIQMLKFLSILNQVRRHWWAL